MQIVVTGATGFIGRYSISSLLLKSHRIFAVGRNLKKIQTTFGNNVTALTWENFEQILPDEINVIINLAGENIGNNLWSKTKKKKIKTSRIDATHKILTWALRYQQKPPHIYNASAVGIYGLKPRDGLLPYLEFTPTSFNRPTDFLSGVGQAWESALQPAIDAGVPVTVMRFAVVLKCHALSDTQKNCTPIVALSAHLDAALQEACLQASMQAALTKPLTLVQAEQLAAIYLRSVEDPLP